MNEDENWRRERRWVVIAADDRFVTLGRDSDPSEDEILAAVEELRRQGLTGWLATMKGDPYVGPVPRLLEVPSLAHASIAFSTAASAVIMGILARRAEQEP